MNIYNFHRTKNVNNENDINTMYMYTIHVQLQHTDSATANYSPSIGKRVC